MRGLKPQHVAPNGWRGKHLAIHTAKIQFMLLFTTIIRYRRLERFFLQPIDFRRMVVVQFGVYYDVIHRVYNSSAAFCGVRRAQPPYLLVI